MELIILLLLLLIFLSALIYSVFVLFRWIYRKGHKKIALIIPSVIIVYLSYSIYTAFYPGDDFYFEEFKKVTSINAPQSAKIIGKDRSYPELHGDYLSISLMRLSKQDYNILLTQISHDKNFIKGELIGSEQLDNVMGKDFDTDRIKFQFMRDMNNAQYLHIAFLNDGKSIITCFVQN